MAENVTIQQADAGMQMPNTAHIMLAPLGSEWPNLREFEFGNPSTYGDFIWFGDSSSENLPEFEVDGGDSTSIRTADRKNTGLVIEDSTLTGTFTQVSRNPAFFELTQSHQDYDQATNSVDIYADSSPREWMMLIVEEDATHVAGLGLYSVTVLSGIGSYSLEYYKETPVKVAVKTDVRGRIRREFLPVQKG